MARYDRQYDYGLRGFPVGGQPRADMGARYGHTYGHQGVAPEVRPNRVTARYNIDYVVGNRGDRYPRNPYSFGGDREDRIGDLHAYRQPYITQGGTRTWRGSGQVREPGGFTGFDRDWGDYDRDFGLGRPRRR